jgi:hypothetical protein
MVVLGDIEVKVGKGFTVTVTGQEVRVLLILPDSVTTSWYSPANVVVKVLAVTPVGAHVPPLDGRVSQLYVGDVIPPLLPVRVTISPAQITEELADIEGIAVTLVMGEVVLQPLLFVMVTL